MPKDVDLGKDLANRLDAAYTGKVKKVEFTFDPYLELDKMDSDLSFARVSLNTYSDIREGRNMWRMQSGLVLTLVSAVGPTDGSWVADWLDSWDMMVKHVREMTVLGQHKPLSVDRDERYDADMFHNNKRLVTQALITFGNIEVL